MERAQPPFLQQSQQMRLAALLQSRHGSSMNPKTLLDDGETSHQPTKRACGKQLQGFFFCERRSFFHSAGAWGEHGRVLGCGGAGEGKFWGGFLTPTACFARAIPPRCSRHLPRPAFHKAQRAPIGCSFSRGGAPLAAPRRPAHPRSPPGADLSEDCGSPARAGALRPPLLLIGGHCKWKKADFGWRVCNYSG